MEVGHIKGFTRVIGESQGYLGLPLRDGRVFEKAVQLEVPMMESAWFLSNDERLHALAGRPIVLRLFGNGHPPVMLYLAQDSDLEEDQLKTIQSEIELLSKPFGWAVEWSPNNWKLEWDEPPRSMATVKRYAMFTAPSMADDAAKKRSDEMRTKLEAIRVLMDEAKHQDHLMQSISPINLITSCLSIIEGNAP